MMSKFKKNNELRFEPLSEKNRNLFEELFGEKGACGGCWCMHFRLPNREWEEGKKNNLNKQKMQALVRNQNPTGILAVINDRAVAWAALAPRDDFSKLSRSRIHKPIDAKKVWSIPCTFIHKDFRNQGISVKLLRGIIDYARKSGIKTLEAYPVIPSGKLPDAFAWIGLYKSFEKAGFEIVDQKSPNRPMVRYEIGK
ncbi:MAG: GNAT family N-acetyltransferase [Crocinitomicaceae bacterium]|nr:GNAT family N-acetyltransferase [Crocinitomicaceae bacterium]